jgi:hypothetical protein
MDFNNIDFTSNYERSRNILEPINFEDLFLLMNTNVKTINEQEARKEFETLLKMNVEEAREIFESNLKNFLTQAKKENPGK